MFHNHFTTVTNNLNCDYVLAILAVPYLDLDGDETTGLTTLVMSTYREVFCNTILVCGKMGTPLYSTNMV